MPPEHWQIPVIIVHGILFGLDFYLFYASRAHSYLSLAKINTSKAGYHHYIPGYDVYIPGYYDDNSG